MKTQVASVIASLWLVSGLGLAQTMWHNQRVAPVQVSFPERPKLKMSSESTPVGPVTSENYTFQGNSYSFVLSNTKLPSMALTFRGPEALYEEASKALLKEHVGAEQLSYSPATVIGKNGAEMTFRNGPEQGKVKFVLVGESLIVAQAVWKAETSDKVVKKFFDSMLVID